MRRTRSAKALSVVNLFALTLAMLLPLSARPVLAQTTTGSIRGTVTDQNGAPVVDATVTARNQGTNVEAGPFKTTGEGIYDIPGLTPGRYTVTVESAGFSRAVTTDVNVNLGVVTPVDVSLQPGAVTETVTVVAGTEEVVNREQAQISATFETRKVEELPSNAAGSGLDTLALLAPGIIPSSQTVSNTNGTGLSVNGNRERSNNFQIDGSDNNDLSIGGPSYFVGNMDQVAEYQVITNNFSAQYGRNQGAVVNIVTKAGTNQFHGTAFEYHRNQNVLDTLTNIERRSGQEEAPRFLSNVFGGTFGGPIVKDRAFFFGSYQGIRQRQNFISRSQNLAILPSEFARLSSLYPNNPVIEAITTQSAFALTSVGTVRPRTDLGEDAFDEICLPSLTAGAPANCFAAAFPERTVPLPFDQNEFSIRGDLKLTDRDNVYVRYLDQRGNNKNYTGVFNGATAGFFGDIPAFTKNLGGTYTRQLGSAAVNEFKATWQNFAFNFGGGCEASSPGCIPAPEEIAQTFPFITFPGIVGSGSLAALQSIGVSSSFPQGRETTVWQLADTVTLTRGSHTLIMGAEYKRLTNVVPFLPNFQGTFRFAAGGGVSAGRRLVTNATQRLTLAVGNPIINYSENDQYYFVQDDWKVKDNLTLNLGLRYEYTGQPINDLADLTEERESGPNPLFNPALPLSVRTVPRIPPDKNNFAPRVGFAWTPRVWKSFFGEDATVIRGGYSIAYDPAFYNILLNVSNTAPNAASLLANNIAATGSGRFGFIQGATAQRVQEAASAAGILPIGKLDPRLLDQTIVGSDFHAPYSQQFSLGLQRQINRNNVAEIRYVGTRGVGLFQTVNRNPRVDALVNGFSIPFFNADGDVALVEDFPGFPQLLPQGITPLHCVNNPATPDNEGACNGRILQHGRLVSRENTATSAYHSLQTRYNGRFFSNSLSLGAAYTFSKTMDNASEVFAISENSSFAQNPFDINRGEWSLSQLDRPHAFSANFIYDVPFRKEQHGVIGRLLGGWQLNGTYVLTSGRTFTPTQFFNGSFFGIGNSYIHDVADMLRPFWGNPNAPRTAVGITDTDARLFLNTLGFDIDTINFFFPASPTGFYSFNELNTNFAAVPVTPNDVRFIFNGPGAARRFGTPFGDVPRNSQRGPKLNQVNFSIFKNTKVRENLTVQFRTEIYNLFNHPNPGYGVATGIGGWLANGAVPDPYVEDSGIGELSFFNDPDNIEYGRRVIQFGLRIIF